MENKLLSYINTLSYILLLVINNHTHANLNKRVYTNIISMFYYIYKMKICSNDNIENKYIYTIFFFIRCFFFFMVN